MTDTPQTGGSGGQDDRPHFTKPSFASRHVENPNGTEPSQTAPTDHTSADDTEGDQAQHQHPTPWAQTPSPQHEAEPSPQQLAAYAPPTPTPTEEPAVDDSTATTEEEQKPKATKKPWPRKLGKPRRKVQRDGEPFKRKRATSSNGDAFYVPAPGGRLSGPRGQTMALRWTGLAVGGLLLLGSCAVGGMVTVGAVQSAPGDGTLSQAELDKYHLDTYDTDAAAAFASRYLQHCLWTPTGDATAKDRQTALDRMSASSGDDPTCKYQTDSAKERTVTWTAFSGYSEPVPSKQNARYIGVQVRTSAGTSTEYVVPVWFKHPETGEGPRVIGPVGTMPLPKMGTPEGGSNTDERLVDQDLSSKLAKQFMPEFLTAWADSDTATLQQFVSNSATGRATTGLGGAFVNPKVTSVTAYPPKSAVVGEMDNEFRYTEGSRIQVEVGAMLTSKATKATQPSTYRMELVRRADRWYVADVHGGAVGDLPTGDEDSDGGVAPDTSNDPTTSPSTSASPSTKPGATSTPGKSNGGEKNNTRTNKPQDQKPKKKNQRSKKGN